MSSIPREFDPLLDRPPSRYVVGIDLGTTNSAVAYFDTESSRPSVAVLRIPQLVEPSVVESRETLPSFLYFPAVGEIPAEALRLPWSEGNPAEVVGALARDHAGAAGRSISSAKSWLCHTGVDRRARLLPWHAAPDLERLSPVEASARYLKHIAQAWEHQFPRAPLAEQEIVLTLPASFDEVARELTVAAAAEAGLPRVVLLEEPQAAFYAWIARHEADWPSRVEAGWKILVCDMGGGTTDFTLIRVRRAGDAADGRVQFHRVAVGDHLILGGDNLDLALAHHVEEKLGGGKFAPAEFETLLRVCRRAKETLLGENPPSTHTLNLPGRGSRVLGGARQVELSGDEVAEVLLEGFFPRVGLEEKPQRRVSGFQEFGLPFAADPAVTRYLGTFLSAHRHSGGEPVDAAGGSRSGDVDPARPDLLLFNGGLFASPQIRERLLQQLHLWFRTAHEPDWRPVVLAGERLDLAVALGAAYYGMVRRGSGTAIAAELARSYYVGVERGDGRQAAVCLMPGQARAGEHMELEHRFHLRVGKPAEFPFYSSSTRLTDPPGAVVEIDPEQLRTLPAIRTVIQSRRRRGLEELAVRLHARLTEIGTLDLWCRSEEEAEQAWRLQFDARAATETDRAVGEIVDTGGDVIDESLAEACRGEVERTFGPAGKEHPDSLLRRLTAATGLERSAWPPSLLRRIWEALLEQAPGRLKSAAHEARWLNLVGYALRPGYGLPVDDWRVAETWRAVHGKTGKRSDAGRVEGWILWRRIAGGLSEGQQRALAEPLLAPLRTMARRGGGKGPKGRRDGLSPQESVEAWRLLGSLEYLDASLKRELGDILLRLLDRSSLAGMLPAVLWTLGRLGQRVPTYGPLNTVLPTEVAEGWIDRLPPAAWELPEGRFAAMLLARRTHDRYRDVSPLVREAVLARLAGTDVAHLRELVSEGGRLDAQEERLVFGESLPVGLRLGG